MIKLFSNVRNENVSNQFLQQLKSWVQIFPYLKTKIKFYRVVIYKKS